MRQLCKQEVSSSSSGLVFYTNKPPISEEVLNSMPPASVRKALYDKASECKTLLENFAVQTLELRYLDELHDKFWGSVEANYFESPGVTKVVLKTTEAYKTGNPYLAKVADALVELGVKYQLRRDGIEFSNEALDVLITKLKEKNPPEAQRDPRVYQEYEDHLRKMVLDKIQAGKELEGLLDELDKAKAEATENPKIWIDALRKLDTHNRDLEND